MSKFRIFGSLLIIVIVGFLTYAANEDIGPSSAPAARSSGGSSFEPDTFNFSK